MKQLHRPTGHSAAAEPDFVHVDDSLAIEIGSFRLLVYSAASLLTQSGG